MTREGYIKLHGSRWVDSHAVCSDPECPCAEVLIPRDEGYIFVVDNGNGLLSANITCEEGARLRMLDLQIAHNDAMLWWRMGMVPARPTPIKSGHQQAPYSSSLTNEFIEGIEVRKRKEREDFHRRQELLTEEVASRPGIQGLNKRVGKSSSLEERRKSQFLDTPLGIAALIILVLLSLVILVYLSRTIRVQGGRHDPTSGLEPQQGLPSSETRTARSVAPTARSMPAI